MAVDLPGWTVGQLRDALLGVPDDLVVLVRAREESDDGDTDIIGGIYATCVEPDHLGESPDVFCISASSCDADFEEPRPALVLVKGGT